MARRTIHQNELGGFKIDDDGQLYWQDQKVVTEMMLKLPKSLEWLAGGAALAVIFSLLFDVADRLGAFPSEPQPPIEITVSLKDLKAQK